MTALHNLNRLNQKAFTLVETILAMGIVAFAMLPLIGLVPIGLTNLRDAITCTQESQIVQTVSNQILLTPYSLVTDKYSAPQTTYYSDEGTELPESTTHGRIYTVKVEMREVSAPATSSAVAVASKSVLIEITNIQHPLNPKRYTLVVPKA